MNNNNIRVRFAPSPTGKLHLGGARTAIYNWLFAQKRSGKFLLRIEDTDIERSDKKLVTPIIDSLKWLDLDWDEEIVYQSQRFELYDQAVKKLLEEQKAYRCFCSEEDLQQEREKYSKKEGSYKYSGRCRKLSPQKVKEKLEHGEEFSVRLKTDSFGSTDWSDIIYGDISFENKELNDFIIQRSDGTPTYQLAVVVDDSEMNISHVIRGEDHVPNTPKQINLFHALEKEPPKYCHVPLLLGPDKKSLSKRHGAASVNKFIEKGYSAESVFNYLTLLGRTAKDQKEVMNRDESIENFAIDKISKKPTVFDEEKLEWLSGKHISQESNQEIYDHIKQYLDNKGWIELNHIDKTYIISVINLLKSRVKKYTQFVEWGDYFFVDPEKYDTESAEKYWDSTQVNQRMEKLIDKLEKIGKDNWNTEQLEDTIRGLADSLDLGAGKIIHPLRLALTGQSISPGIFKTVELIGKTKTLERMKQACTKLPK